MLPPPPLPRKRERRSRRGSWRAGRETGRSILIYQNEGGGGTSCSGRIRGYRIWSRENWEKTIQGNEVLGNSNPDVIWIATLRIRNYIWPYRYVNYLHIMSSFYRKNPLLNQNCFAISTWILLRMRFLFIWWKDEIKRKRMHLVEWSREI